MPPRSSGHKYVKRTGTKGNYRYFYKNADGSLREDSTKGKGEHTRRLAAGKIAGHHSMSAREIASHVGHPNAQRANSAIQNMRARVAEGDHGFDTHHLHEAKHEDTTSAAYRAKMARAPEAAATPAARRTSPPARSSRGFGTIKEAALRREGWTQSIGTDGLHSWKSPNNKLTVKKIPGNKFEVTVNSTGEKTLHPSLNAVLLGARENPSAQGNAAKKEKIRKLRAKLAELEGGVTLPGTGTEHLEPAQPFISTAPSGEETAARGRAESRRVVRQAGENANRRAAGETVPFGEGITRPRARATPARAASAAATSRRVAALAEADPAVATAEAPVTRMAETAAAGGNPYLTRAKEIFDRIKADVKPERAEITKHMLSILGSGVTAEAEILSKYKEASGRSRVRTVPWADFEKATFMSKEEVIGNPPLDMAVERMKRGYAEMQYQRMKPFVKDSWHSQHPGGHPPMPTFGDLKSWGDAGGKPSWAGTTRLAVPKEVFDAAVKKGGKPQYPPAWMPIHLMPAWNYIAMKTDTPYQTRAPQIGSFTSKINVGSQASFQEGVAIASLRKYVQMRGGADQLVDIPSSKLAEVGLSHAKIFKAVGLSDAQLKSLMKTKIIDMVELLPFIDAELAGGKSLKKSFSLVVDITEPSFKKSKLSDETVRKSLIREIRRLRNEKECSYMSRV